MAAKKLPPSGIELSQLRKTVAELRAMANFMETLVNPFGTDDVEALVRQMNASNAATWAFIFETKKRRFM